MEEPDGYLPPINQNVDTLTNMYSTKNLQDKTPKNKSYSYLRKQGNVFERLKKRTLRSKLIKLIDKNLNFSCGKYSEYNSRMKNIHNNIIKFADLEFQNRINDPDFKKQQFHFSPKFNNKQYQPSLKDIIFEYPEKEILKPLPNIKEDTENAIKNICKELTIDELLQIGEDPGYFIIKEEHRQREQLLLPSTWDQMAYQAKMNQKRIYSNNKINKSVSEGNLFQEDKYNENKLYIKHERKINPRLFENTSEIYKQKLDESLDKLIDKHSQRFERWQKRALIEKTKKQEKQLKQKLNYESKSYRAEITLESIQQQIQKAKETQKDRDAIINQQIEQNRKFKNEDDEIYLMNIELRRICTDRQLKETKEKSYEEFKQKLRESQKKRESIRYKLEYQAYQEEIQKQTKLNTQSQQLQEF